LTPGDEAREGKIGRRESEPREVKLEIPKLMKEVKEAKARLSNAHRENEQLNGLNGNLEITNNDLRSGMAILQSSLDHKTRQYNVAVESRDSWRTCADEIYREMVAQGTKLQAANSKLAEELRTAEGEISKSKEQIENLKKKAANDAMKAQSALEQKEKELEALRISSEANSKEAARKLAAKTQELQGLQKEKDNEAQEAKRQLATKDKALQDLQQKGEEESKEAARRLAAKEQEMQGLQQQKEEESKEADRKLAAKTQELENLQKEKDDKGKKADQELEEAKKQVKDLNGTMAQRDSLVTRIKDSMVVTLKGAVGETVGSHNSWSELRDIIDSHPQSFVVAEEIWVPMKFLVWTGPREGDDRLPYKLATVLKIALWIYHLVDGGDFGRGDAVELVTELTLRISECRDPLVFQVLRASFEKLLGRLNVKSQLGGVFVMAFTQLLIGASRRYPEFWEYVGVDESAMWEHFDPYIHSCDVLLGQVQKLVWDLDAREKKFLIRLKESLGRFVLVEETCTLLTSSDVKWVLVIIHKGKKVFFVEKALFRRVDDPVEPWTSSMICPDLRPSRSQHPRLRAGPGGGITCSPSLN
jgi:chemotaxis protein histidine kinase CheA